MFVKDFVPAQPDGTCVRVKCLECVVNTVVASLRVRFPVIDWFH